MRLKQWGLIFVLLILSVLSYGQQTRTHGVFWGRLVLSDKINTKMSWEAYLQKRTQNIPKETSIFGAPHFFSIWLWMNYAVSKNVKLSVSPFGYFDSYGFLTQPSDVDIPGIKEFRWVVRLESEQKLKYFNYSNRYSVEYRRRDIRNDNVYQPNWRLRYQAKIEKPVNNLLSAKKPVSFFLTDEIFMQFGKAVRANPNVFDQNRLNIGASYEVVKNIKVSLSYLNIMQQRNSGKDFDDANAVWVILAFNNLFSQFSKRH